MISELILILFEVAVMVKHAHRAKSWGGGGGGLSHLPPKFEHIFVAS